MRDVDYLCADLQHRGLSALGCEWVDDLGADEEVDRWNFVLDGRRVLVTSSSGMYLRNHSHHVAIAPAGSGELEGGDRSFVAVRIGKAYASGGRSGFLEALHRTRQLDIALEVINLEFENWRLGEHAVLNQPAGQGPVDRADFDRAFREHPDRPGEPAWRADAVAGEIYVPNAEADLEPGPTVLRLMPYRPGVYSWLESS